MRTLDLPPPNYHHESEYVFGPWVELGIGTDPNPVVQVRPRWIVEIGEGTVGRERATVELNPMEVMPLPMGRGVRLAFRARLAPR